MDSLIFDLPIGLRSGGDVLKEVELLRTNGVAEKVFVTKIPERPYTWQGNVLAVAIKRIGNIEIGAEARRSYVKDNAVTIPEAVKNLTMADVNTLLVEIHRRLWQSFIPRQEVICKYCGKRLLADIDLDKIDYRDETKEFMEECPNYDEIVVDLVSGFTPPSLGKITDKPEYSDVLQTEYNRMTFRAPLLRDAIKNERKFSDSIGFWRCIAKDCLLRVESVEDGTVTSVLPTEFHMYYGMKLYDEYLSGKDLKAIRSALTEYLPTLPFAYYDRCGCDEQREIPYSMEASSFFSE